MQYAIFIYFFLIFLCALAMAWDYNYNVYPKCSKTKLMSRSEYEALLTRATYEMECE